MGGVVLVSALAQIAEYAAGHAPGSTVPVGRDAWHAGLRDLMGSFVVHHLQNGVIQTSSDDKGYALVGRWIVLMPSP
jgi:hypothetical protein